MCPFRHNKCVYNRNIEKCAFAYVCARFFQHDRTHDWSYFSPSRFFFVSAFVLYLSLSMCRPFVSRGARCLFHARACSTRLWWSFQCWPHSQLYILYIHLAPSVAFIFLNRIRVKWQWRKQNMKNNDNHSNSNTYLKQKQQQQMNRKFSINKHHPNENIKHPFFPFSKHHSSQSQRFCRMLVFFSSFRPRRIDTAQCVVTLSPADVIISFGGFFRCYYCIICQFVYDIYKFSFWHDSISDSYVSY